MFIYYIYKLGIYIKYISTIHILYIGIYNGFVETATDLFFKGQEDNVLYSNNDNNNKFNKGYMILIYIIV
jgi:hypothetical protein